MNSKVLQRTILGAVLAGGTALGALAQIPVPPLPGLDVRITTRRPPPLRVERRSPRPGDGYLWVQGQWNWDGDRWDWVPGRWDRPAVAEAYWIPARYIRTSRGTIYEPGHWSNQQVVAPARAHARARARAGARPQPLQGQLSRLTLAKTWLNAASPPDTTGGLAAFFWSDEPLSPRRAKRPCNLSGIRKSALAQGVLSGL